MEIVLVFAAFVVAFGLVAAAVGWFSRLVIRKMVAERHAALDEIMATGGVPASWRAASGSSLAGRHHLKKLERLQRYVRQTALVESEEVRSDTLRRLDEVHRRWDSESDGQDHSSGPR